MKQQKKTRRNFLKLAGITTLNLLAGCEDSNNPKNNIKSRNTDPQTDTEITLNFKHGFRSGEEGKVFFTNKIWTRINSPEINKIEAQFNESEWLKYKVKLGPKYEYDNRILAYTDELILKSCNGCETNLKKYPSFDVVTQKNFGTVFGWNKNGLRTQSSENYFLIGPKSELREEIKKFLDYARMKGRCEDYWDDQGIHYKNKRIGVDFLITRSREYLNYGSIGRGLFRGEFSAVITYDLEDNLDKIKKDAEFLRENGAHTILLGRMPKNEAKTILENASFEGFKDLDY